MEANSILIYTDGEIIGDGVIKLSFLSALKSAFPGSKLIWLCSGSTVYTGVLKELASPYIDELIELPSSKIVLKDFEPLKERKFDIIIDTQYSLKRALWLRRLPHSMFLSSAARYLVSHKYPKSWFKKRGRVIDELMILGSLASGSEMNHQPITLLDQKWNLAAKELLPDGSRYVGFVPGAGQEHKKWPLERYMSLAKHVVKQGFEPVFILGPQDQELEAVIKQSLPEAHIPLANLAEDLAGACMTIALAKRLEAVVANDSGGGHLVSAANIPMVSLLRSNSVRRKFLPVTKRIIGLVPEDFDGTAMDDMPEIAVTKALDEVLG